MKDESATEEAVSGASSGTSASLTRDEERDRAVGGCLGGRCVGGRSSRQVVGALSGGRVVDQDVVLLCFRKNS